MLSPSYMDTLLCNVVNLITVSPCAVCTLLEELSPDSCQIFINSPVFVLSVPTTWLRDFTPCAILVLETSCLFVACLLLTSCTLLLIAIGLLVYATAELSLCSL